MPVDIRLRAGGEHLGRVARVRLEADAAARELPVEIAFDVLPPRFAIHQEAEVSIQVATHRGLVIPLSALLRREGQPGVLVVREGRAQSQPIEVGALGETGLIVEEGLESGDRVVAAAPSVPAGARVRAAGED